MLRDIAEVGNPQGAGEREGGGWPRSATAMIFTSTTGCALVKVGKGGLMPPCPKAQSYGSARRVRL